MFGLELSLAQKLQLGFVVAMFAIAGFLVYRNTRPVPEMTITTFTETRHLGLDPARPISANNPVDPNRNMLITKFACHDGQLEVTEYPNDSEAKPTFVFRADQRRNSYYFYRNPLEKIKTIGDPVKQTLSYMAYYVSEGRGGMGYALIAKCGLSPEQLKAEKEIRGQLLDEVDRIRQSARHGLYEPDLYENVLRALEAYKARDGDPTKDATKAELARKVMDLALDFLSRQQKEEAVAREKFVSDVDALLSTDQKARLAEAAKVAAAPVQRPVRPPGKPRAG